MRQGVRAEHDEVQRGASRKQAGMSSRGSRHLHAVSTGLRQEMTPSMQTQKWQWIPADGRAPRIITVTIGPPSPHGDAYAAEVDIAGFDEPCTKRIYGADAEQAAELASKTVPALLELRAHGGSLIPVD